MAAIEENKHEGDGGAQARLAVLRSFLADIDPAVKQYAELLTSNGFDTPELLARAKIEDFEKIGVPLGHQRALECAAKSFRTEGEIARGDGEANGSAIAQIDIEEPDRVNPRSAREMGRTRRNLFISAAVFLGVAFIGLAFELLAAPGFCRSELDGGSNNEEFDEFVGDYSGACVNYGMVAAGFPVTFVAFLITACCMTGCCRCNEDPCCCRCFSEHHAYELSGRREMVHHKTALRAAYILTFLSFPLGWWYVWLPFEVFAVFWAKLIAFVLLIVAECV